MLPPCVVVVFFSLTVASAQARELVDSTGTHVHLVDHPSRIVTLAPSLGELVSDFLGMDLQRIVGVSESTDYPPALKKVASIGPYQRINLEKVLSLKPDLVLATEDGNMKDQIAHLRELEVPVVVLSTRRLSEVSDSMKKVAEALGSADPKQKEQYQSLIARFEKGIADIRNRAAKRCEAPTESGKRMNAETSASKAVGTTGACGKKRVVIQLDENPLIVVGGKSFLNDAIALVGAENVYGDSNAGYPRPSQEDLIQKNPDVILVATFGTDRAPFKKRAASWTRYAQLKAVRSHQVKVIFGDPLLRPSMRLLEGLSLLEKAIYGG
jgi:iron complex transport system substrate-binding protein